MYDSDLRDAEWALIQPLLQNETRRGRKPIHSKRIILNAIFYRQKSGCQWPMLPSEFPPWSTVYDHFRRMKKSGKWERILRALNKAKRKKSSQQTTQSLDRRQPKRQNGERRGSARL